MACPALEPGQVLNSPMAYQTPLPAYRTPLPTRYKELCYWPMGTLAPKKEIPLFAYSTPYRPTRSPVLTRRGGTTRDSLISGTL
eukprot:1226300-Rhodomonas_salina.1